jgi:AraC-like DNA-binding protein
MSAPIEHTFPASHALQLVSLVKRWAITAEELLEGVGLTEAELAAPHARISVETLRALSERARLLTAEPGIGFYLGLQKRLSMYGYLGFAAMTAATVREGLELAVRYAPAISTSLSFVLRIEGDAAALEIEEHADLGGARDIAVFSLLVGMRQLTAEMTGRDLDRVLTDIPFPRPGYFDRFAHLLPNARFEQPKMRVHFPVRALDVPLLTPDRAALALAREACERQLAELGYDHGLPARVRRLAMTPHSLLPIEDVARALHVSTRTLKRRLADRGLTFSALIDRERYERALELLCAPELSLEDVAHRLDYSTLPNFARAFRRWTGETPAQYRRRRQSGGGA